jgi:hypothetical protein
MRSRSKRWFAGLRGEVPATRKPRRPVFSKPCVEGLEERIAPATDIWIATAAGNWSVGTNWNFGIKPMAGMDVLFQVAAGAGAASCTLDAATPTLASVTFAASWDSYQLSVTSSGALNANNIILSARTTGTKPTYDITTASGTSVTVNSDLEFNGGGIGGSGTLTVTNTLNVGGTTTGDKPTLGCQLNVGDGTTNTLMSFKANSVPLVVKDNANITVKTNATLNFDGALPQPGNLTVTAISNGDTNTHTITVAGGIVRRTDTAEMFVAMGITVNSGSLIVTTGVPPNGGQNGPLDFTEASAGPGNGGLIVNGGTVTVSGNLSVDEGIYIAGGYVDLNVNYTLTSGQGGASRTVYVMGGYFQVAGILQAYGGVDMLGGMVATNGNTTGVITMGAADDFYMDGGSLMITVGIAGQPALGELRIAGGNMTISGGTVEVDCDSTNNKHGQLQVDNTLTITSGNTATFVTQDLDFAAFGYVMNAITTGSESGDFSTYNLPRAASLHHWGGNT